MKRFKNILLIHPCDPATLDRAVILAQNNRARLTVVKVAREVVGATIVTSPGGPALDMQDLVVAEYRSQLKDFISPVKRKGVRVSTKVLVGTSFLAIIREVIAHQRDLVIMTAEGKGGLKKRLFGSTSRHLMRKCPCPLWVMKPTRRKRYLRIMAAIDPDSENETRDSLNGLIIQLAASLAEQDGAELHIAHAWTMIGESLLRGRARVPELEIREYVREERANHRKQLDALLAKHGIGAARIHMVRGNADAVIPHIAKSERVDLLVMGTVCRTGIPGFFIGNTAERILDEVDCSVLTVKPEGFKTPVKPV